MTFPYIERTVYCAQIEKCQNGKWVPVGIKPVEKDSKGDWVPADIEKIKGTKYLDTDVQKRDHLDPGNDLEGGQKSGDQIATTINKFINNNNIRFGENKKRFDANPCAGVNAPPDPKKEQELKEQCDRIHRKLESTQETRTEITKEIPVVTQQREESERKLREWNSTGYNKEIELIDVAKKLAKIRLDEANKEVGNVDKLQKSLKKDPDAQNRKAIESRIAKLRPPATEHLDAANKEIAEVSKRKEAAENTAKQLQSEVEKYKNKRADLVKRAAALHIEIDQLQQDDNACKRRNQ